MVAFYIEAFLASRGCHHWASLAGFFIQRYELRLNGGSRMGNVKLVDLLHDGPGTPVH